MRAYSCSKLHESQHADWKSKQVSTGAEGPALSKDHRAELFEQTEFEGRATMWRIPCAAPAAPARVRLRERKSFVSSLEKFRCLFLLFVLAVLFWRNRRSNEKYYY